MKISEKDLRRVMGTVLFIDSRPEAVANILEQGKAEVLSLVGGEVILSPDAKEKKLGVLLSGKATVNTPDPSKKMLLRLLGVGEPFGFANLFSDEPFVSVIRANGPCRVFLLSEETVRLLLEKDQAFLYRYLSFLSGRIRFLNMKIGYLTAGSAERRLALYLYSIGKREFRLPISISALSELLDVGRASLYRAFDRLCEDGYLQKNGRNFILPSPDDLLNAY